MGIFLAHKGGSLDASLNGFKMKIPLYLVTGGAGFIGSHLVAKLLDSGARVRVIDNFSSGKWENIAPFRERIELIEGDIRDESAVKRAMSGATYVTHQAALRSVPKSMTRPRDFHDVNVSGMLALLLAARDERVK